MLDSGTALLLFLLFVGLVGMSLYVVWLQVNLWLTRQILNRAPVIMTNLPTDSVKSGGGCLGNLGLPLLIMILAGVFATLYFS
ncbi:hypothetical protein BH10CHL1_BH10CHL1_41950 [soil metagenome]